MVSTSAAKQTVLPVILRIPERDNIALSFAQERLWFLSQLKGANQAYYVPWGMHLDGDLDCAALSRALEQIVVRHEVLRTTFVVVDGTPVQKITSAEHSQFVLLEHDLRQHGDVQAELGRLAAQEARASFDLEHGPLIRGRLIRLAEGRHALLLTTHHIVSDGWSMRLLVEELSVLYCAFLRGEDNPLPELEIQYADYAVWQRRWLCGEVLQQQAAYWKGALAGLPALLNLPADHPRPTQQDYAGAYVELMLDSRLTADLKALCRKHGTTLYMTLLAAWAALLARLSGEHDVVVGSPIANRRRAEIENLIGFFVNTLALRIDLSGSPTVTELLARVKRQTIAALQHQDIPFEQIVEILQPARSLAHSPLFQVMFAWQNMPQSMLRFPGLELSPIREIPHTTAKFDLTLFLWETNDVIAGGVEYATSLFEQATIRRYIGYLRNLLKSMAADANSER